MSLKYPSNISRLFAGLCILAVVAGIMAKYYGVQFGAFRFFPQTSMIVGYAFLVLGKRFDITVQVLAPNNDRQKQFVSILGWIRLFGILFTVVAAILLVLAFGSDSQSARQGSNLLIAGFVFIFGVLLQGISAVLYRPFIKTPTTST